MNLLDKQTILCPCNICGNHQLSSTYDDVKYDLVKYGFNSNVSAMNNYKCSKINSIGI